MSSSTDPDPGPCPYELVPVLALPEVDLSISVRSHFVHSPTGRRMLRFIGGSVVVFLGYLVYLAIAVAVFLVPASLGGTLAIVGVVGGLPGAFNSISNLRYEIVVLLVTTYDAWYFGAVSTIVTMLLSVLFDDVRSLVMLVSWVSFLTNVFTDASIIGLRRIWISQAVSVVCYVVMAVALGAAITEDLRVIDIAHYNGHALPAEAVVQNGLWSMVVVVLRNLYREFCNAKKTSQIMTDSYRPVVTCVSYRCRLRVQPKPTASTGGRHFDGEEETPGKTTERSDPHAVSAESAKTRLRFVPYFQSIEAWNTLVPDRWLRRIRCHHRFSHRCGSWSRRLFLGLGCTGFVISNTTIYITLLAPTLADRLALECVTALGTCASLVFTLICMSMTQRQLLRAVVTSFDFLFIAVQGTIVHLALVDLMRWHPVMVMAMFSSWLWSTWMMCWDAILPPARETLGLRTRFAAWVGTGLIVLMTTCTFLTLVVVPPGTISDRIILRVELLGQTIELRPLTWYVSCSATIFAWSIRVMWRLWQANEDELVVLDGGVVYEKRIPRTA